MAPVSAYRAIAEFTNSSTTGDSNIWIPLAAQSISKYSRARSISVGLRSTRFAKRISIGGIEAQFRVAACSNCGMTSAFSPFALGAPFPWAGRRSSKLFCGFRAFTCESERSVLNRSEISFTYWLRSSWSGMLLTSDFAKVTSFARSSGLSMSRIRIR